MAQQQTHELQREVQATLAARRELGQEYDEHFIARLTDQITARVRQEVALTPRRHPTGLSSGERTSIAICSLIFGIPLVGIGAATAGAIGLIVAFVALVLINVVVNAAGSR
jgi:hypothetical protein